MPPSGFEHGRVIHLIGGALALWEERAEGWVCVGTDVAFTMKGGNWLCPDAAVVRRERLPENIDGAVPFPPEIAFEVISMNDTWMEVQRKRHIYSANGVVQVWIDPWDRQVEVICAKHGTRIFREGEKVVVEELPGFGMNLFPLPSARSESKS
jgi:Uma2 family endonuclease